ncbi:Uu.00g123690.m01.CDS01 [Anthostomella pinea]|uniref:Uu.00g123690.m01.CDS01 n=1 Tax=Anthostomella pinea TaxID=933095 RepID=A0AAI8VIE5_9PEZI|nr:Uu.00g123690.m01.CDS01 [Anthostomella pinea]
MTPAPGASGDSAPLINSNPQLQSYYYSLESRIGYRLLLGGTRHFSYWDHDTYWPFPLTKGLRNMEDKLAEALALPAGSQVLDAGCGVGHVALHMAKAHGLRVEAIDIVDHHVYKASQNITRSGLPEGTVKVRKMDYHHLEDLPSQSMDGIYTMETFVHATDPKAVLDGFYRLLRPGGRLVPPDMAFVPFGAAVLFFFSSSFLIAWNFYFPTPTEQFMWRAFGLYHSVFVVFGGVYYLIEAVKWTKRRKRQGGGGQSAVVNDDASAVRSLSVRIGLELEGFDPEAQLSAREGLPRAPRQVVMRYLCRIRPWIASWRDISVDQDPEMAVALRVIIPVTVTCIVYVFSRFYLYIEVFVGLRSGPIGVYLTVNKFIPFMGDG